ncbi:MULTISPECIES: DUF4030 domain-containing protein [Bacillus]|uniref:DUF4030 domain-containing protein n=3 Tax=Bacillus thuringiensis TaxID=1428 RepID=A0AAP4Q9T9_BACTU|nr:MULTISPECIES: DUF4030 domain-containing protein [Bacillus]MEC2880022.1 DUF4030 domain-containing protein [Bacillus cereus]AEA16189.1 hypothetical protein CT43_CH2510 [Bacillus thuringiensis serovar chinensis CT-43]AFV18316.1 hypothetical protein BTB_c26320 [Bacillus thuringiensis Bt407]AGG01264.1 lipoprotein, putative [Bacillus thuringiensis serovar thuringiensis str. IS5056]ARP57887.1 hypothetical protein CAB88_12765 [Bacillus thuringiensis]
MRKGKKLLVFLFPLALLCACENDIEDAKSEESIVMNIATAAVKEEYFFSATIRDVKERILDLEIADSENANEIKKEINKRLQIQGVMSYKVNVSQRNKEIVNAEHRWELVFGQIFDGVFRKNGYEGFGIQQINYKKNQPVTIDIKTKISDDEVGARELGQKIEKEVEGVLKTEAVKKWIENDSYAIGIYDIDDRKIN